MLAHLILGDMAKTADEPKVRMKPHMVFVGASDHYDAEFVQKDAEKVLETLNDPFSYPNTQTRPCELFKIEKRELSVNPLIKPTVHILTAFPSNPNRLYRLHSIHTLHCERAGTASCSHQYQYQRLLSRLLQYESAEARAREHVMVIKVS